MVIIIAHFLNLPTPENMGVGTGRWLLISCRQSNKTRDGELLRPISRDSG